jgi:hypothetical protein
MAGPAIPTGLSTKSTERAITLSWGEVKRATSYKVSKKSDAGFLNVYVGEKAQFDDTDTDIGVYYTYKVAAINEGGISPYSEIIEAKKEKAKAVKPPKKVEKPKVEKPTYSRTFSVPKDE